MVNIVYIEYSIIHKLQILFKAVNIRYLGYLGPYACIVVGARHVQNKILSIPSSYMLSVEFRKDFYRSIL